MQTAPSSELVGLGIYGIGEASRLTAVSPGRIRRWLKGYKYRSREKRLYSPPVWQGQLPPISDSYALGFLDLLEVKFVDRFRESGVSWKTIREVSKRAKDRFGTSHAFCTLRFKTDGRAIFKELEAESGEKLLIDFLTSQRHFSQAIEPYLHHIEFKDILPARWWPLGQNRSVVLDPERSFGRPIVATEGVPTEVLASAYSVEKSIKQVAYWYEVKESAVRDAIAFENHWPREVLLRQYRPEENCQGYRCPIRT
jgi:uncharacterized protein (DUF433 family)/DNA-binding transcriptional MerR regulator